MLFPRFKTVPVPQGYDTIDQARDMKLEFKTKDAADTMTDICNRFPPLYEEDFSNVHKHDKRVRQIEAYRRAQANV